MGAEPDNTPKREAAARVRILADALFVASRNPRTQSLPLGLCGDQLALAARSNCLHVIAKDGIPAGFVVAAILSDEDVQTYPENDLASFRVKSFVTGSHTVILDAISIDVNRDQEFFAEVQKIMGESYRRPAAAKNRAV